jgi:hypothetical protein
MYDFIDKGNIRVFPESGGIHLSQKPGEKARATLRKFIASQSGEVYVDLDTVGEHTSSPEYAEYNKGTRADRILNDIDKFYVEAQLSKLYL